MNYHHKNRTNIYLHWQRVKSKSSWIWARRHLFNFYSKTNKMHQCLKFIYTLHVLDSLSIHHQEFKTVHTATGCTYSISWASACNTDTTPTQPHRNSNTHQTKNNTTNMVIQPNSRKLLMTDILMSETCWALKKWNKIASDIKLVFYSSTITMMHGPINVRLNTFMFEQSTEFNTLHRQWSPRCRHCVILWWWISTFWCNMPPLSAEHCSGTQVPT